MPERTFNSHVLGDLFQIRKDKGQEMKDFRKPKYCNEMKLHNKHCFAIHQSLRGSIYDSARAWQVQAWKTTHYNRIENQEKPMFMSTTKCSKENSKCKYNEHIRRFFQASTGY